MERWFSLGLAYAYSNQRDKSYNAFERCKDCFAANQNIIMPALKSDDETLKNSFIKLFQRSLESDLWMARTTTDPSVALKHYNFAMTIPPLKKELLPRDFLTMLSAYHQMGNTQNAQDIVDSALVYFPNNVDLIFAKADLIESNIEKIVLLKRLLSFEFKVDPEWFDWGTAYNNLAWAYCCNKEYSEGLPYSRIAVKRNPEHDYSWETLGELCYFTGDYKGCIEAMKKCLDISDKYKETAGKFISMSKKKM